MSRLEWWVCGCGRDTLVSGSLVNVSEGLCNGEFLLFWRGVVDVGD